MLAFRADDVSLADIMQLIDKGYRFRIITDLDGEEKATNVEEYLNGEVDVFDFSAVSV